MTAPALSPEAAAVIAAVEGLEADYKTLRAEHAVLVELNRSVTALLCSWADAVDVADASDGGMPVAEEVLCATRAIRDGWWAGIIDGATPEDFAAGGA